MKHIITLTIFTILITLFIFILQTNEPHFLLNSNDTCTAGCLNESKNCPTNNPTLKKLAQDLCNGKSRMDCAKAIYKWVHDSIKYEFYYNSRKGAAGCYNSRSCNCADHSHLLCSLYRSVGLCFRYKVNNKYNFLLYRIFQKLYLNF